MLRLDGDGQWVGWFFDIVKKCAEMSAQKRGVTLPDDEATGRRMGIKTMVRRDSDAVKQTAMPPTPTAK